MSYEGHGDRRMLFRKKPKKIKKKICRYARTYCSQYKKEDFGCNHDGEAIVYCGYAKRIKRNLGVRPP